MPRQTPGCVEQRGKQRALGRVAVEFGFVFALDDFVGALSRISP